MLPASCLLGDKILYCSAGKLRLCMRHSGRVSEKGEWPHLIKLSERWPRRDLEPLRAGLALGSQANVPWQEGQLTPLPPPVSAAWASEHRETC